MTPTKKHQPFKLEIAGKPCGCTFSYSPTQDGFKNVCDIHIQRREERRMKREKINKRRYDLLGPIPAGSQARTKRS